MALSGAVGRRVRGRIGRHSGAWGVGRGRQTDRDKATVSHTPGRGPIQANEGDEARGSTAAQGTDPRTAGLQDHPQRKTEAEGPETCAEREDEGRGWKGEEVKRKTERGQKRRGEKRENMRAAQGLLEEVWADRQLGETLERSHS